jgi:FkbM family methyltransferase
VPTTLLRNPYARAVARRVPGLSRAYWGLHRRRIMRRGVADLDYPRARIRIGVGTDAVARKRLSPYEKEPWTVEWLERNVREGDVLYDVGANVGVYSLIAARLAGGGARAVAFEPAYANYDALCENLLLNGADEQVTPLPVVLAESTRLGVLVCEQTDAGQATHSLDGDGPAAYRQPVLVYALDELIETFALPAPTLLKLDVDGAESAVLAGAVRTLRRPELRSLIVEIEVAQSANVEARLAEAGLTLAERFDERQGKPLKDIWYGVFARAGSS